MHRSSRLRQGRQPSRLRRLLCPPSPRLPRRWRRSPWRRRGPNRHRRPSHGQTSPPAQLRRPLREPRPPGVRRPFRALPLQWLPWSSLNRRRWLFPSPDPCHRPWSAKRQVPRVQGPQGRRPTMQTMPRWSSAPLTRICEPLRLAHSIVRRGRRNGKQRSWRRQAPRPDGRSRSVRKRRGGWRRSKRQSGRRPPARRYSDWKGRGWKPNTRRPLGWPRLGKSPRSRKLSGSRRHGWKLSGVKRHEWKPNDRKLSGSKRRGWRLSARLPRAWRQLDKRPNDRKPSGSKWRGWRPSAGTPRGRLQPVRRPPGSRPRKRRTLDVKLFVVRSDDSWTRKPHGVMRPRLQPECPPGCHLRPAQRVEAGCSGAPIPTPNWFCTQKPGPASSS